MRYYWGLVFIFVIAAPQPGNAQILPRFTRARSVCCVPGSFNLSEARLSNPTSASSFEAVDVELAGVASPSPPFPSSVGRAAIKGKTFRMARVSLVNGHCRVSQVAVLIDETGHCTLDLLAEQNPGLLPRDQRSAAMVHHRNRFVITVRPLVGPDAGNGATGLNLTVPPTAASLNFEFWLERGRVRRIHQVSSTYSAALARAFETVDHVAIDLRYE